MLSMNSSAKRVIRAFSTKSGNLQYAGKTVFVTGGSRGIGSGIVRKFAKEGANVVFCGLNIHRESGEKLIEELAGSIEGDVTFVEADLGKRGVAKNLIDPIIAKYGRLDCLVNNAGFHPHATPIDEADSEGAFDLMTLNLYTPWELSKVAVPHLRKTEGNIIHISSFSGTFGQLGSAMYCATKSGLVGMSKSIAIDEAKYNVRSNVISPGNIWTPLWEEHVAGPSEDVEIENGRKAQPLGRYGTPDEVAEVAWLLANSKFTTGIEYLITGGAELGYGEKSRRE